MAKKLLKERFKQLAGIKPLYEQVICDTSTSSACAIKWFQNPNATWASNYINTHSCNPPRTYNYAAHQLYNQALQILQNNPQTINFPSMTFNAVGSGWHDIWGVANQSIPNQQQRQQFIMKMAKAKYAQCQKAICNC
tara:strand:- start:698 stop:1108 length:411 start_codon:yes stop_codon:yes gene_type:complete